MFEKITLKRTMCFGFKVKKEGFDMTTCQPSCYTSEKMNIGNFRKIEL